MLYNAMALERADRRNSAAEGWPSYPQPAATTAEALNVGAYVGNDPINMTDPSGLVRQCATYEVFHYYRNIWMSDEGPVAGPVRPDGSTIHAVCIDAGLPDGMGGPEFDFMEGGGGGGGRSGEQEVCPSVPESRPTGSVTHRQAAVSDPAGAAVANRMARYARVASTRRFPNMDGRNTPRDAYRHFYWNFRMTRAIGPRRAEVFANGYEASFQNNPAEDLVMDTWNNFVGRAMAMDTRYKGMPAEAVAEIALENECLRWWRQ